MENFQLGTYSSVVGLTYHVIGLGINYQPHKTNKPESCLATQETKQRGSLE